MVRQARVPTDLNYVYDLTLTLIQYGADPNVNAVDDKAEETYSSSHHYQQQKQQVKHFLVISYDLMLTT